MWNGRTVALLNDFLSQDPRKRNNANIDSQTRKSRLVCKEVYREGNFSVRRPYNDNSHFKPPAFLLDSIFVNGSYLNHAQDFLFLLSRNYDIYIGGWDSEVDDHAKRFGISEYVQCVNNGIRQVKVHSSSQDIELFVAYSSGLGIALLASRRETIGMKSLLLIGSPYSFMCKWADVYRNYRLVCDDDLIESSLRTGLVDGTQLDGRFQWMDRQFMIGSGTTATSEFGQSYRHTSMPVKAYSDWMDVVRYNALEADNLDFHDESVECYVIFYGQRDYLTGGYSSFEPLVHRMNKGSNCMVIGADLSHRELLGMRALKHLESALTFFRDDLESK